MAPHNPAKENSLEDGWSTLAVPGGAAEQSNNILID